MSKELVNPAWSLFSPALVDNSTVEKEFVEYRTDNTTLSDTMSNFSINTKDLDSWMLPSDAYLQVTCRLTDGAGNAFAAGTKIAMVNNAISLFSRCQYLVDGQLVEEVNHAGVGTSIKGLLEFSDDYKRSTGSAMGWYPDTSTAGADDATNLGFASRMSIVSDNGTMQFMVPLRHIFGFCDTKRCVRGVKHTIKLQKASDANILHRDNAVADGKISFADGKISLWMPVMKPSLKVQAQLESQIRSGSAQRLHWVANNVYRSSQFAQANSTPVWRITSSVSQPRHVFVACQLASRDNTQTSTNAVFDNLGLTNVHLRVNNKQYPLEELTCDYDDNVNDYTRAFLSLTQYSNKYGNSDTGNGVSWPDFKTKYAIYHFDLRHVDTSLINSVSGTTDLEVRARLSAGGNYQMYALVLSERSATLSGSAGNKLRIEVS